MFFSMDKLLILKILRRTIGVMTIYQFSYKIIYNPIVDKSRDLRQGSASTSRASQTQFRCAVVPLRMATLAASASASASVSLRASARVGYSICPKPADRAALYSCGTYRNSCWLPLRHTIINAIGNVAGGTRLYVF